MKLKLQQILSATPAIQKLSKCNLEGFYLFDLIALIQKLQPHIDDFNECNHRMIEKHGGKANKNGRLEFPIEESEQAANIEYRKLLNKEIEADFTKVKIPISKEIKLSVVDVELLSSFVEFFRGSDE